MSYTELLAIQIHLEDGVLKLLGSTHSASVLAPVGCVGLGSQ